MQMLRSGEWWLKSKKDPRWNCSGRTCVGMFYMPDECKTRIEELKKCYGEEPEDLEWGYMKD